MCLGCWLFVFFFFLRIRRPPISTRSRSSAASDVYKRQALVDPDEQRVPVGVVGEPREHGRAARVRRGDDGPVSYTHLRAHETVLDLVCRLPLEKKKIKKIKIKKI